LTIRETVVSWPAATITLRVEMNSCGGVPGEKNC